ncbi:hypothetical protein DAPK24_035840 [Pichia kluyveri]|uniref:tRNA (adenine(58)-N(1))-methyltransferase catalytic subunit TRM61 n=1 Tax=Pichia kluyveri TaxID=36015 RepID=A0AAV5R695_PICKL|nr:hypothetical protein DAPK24_035840 [Pichia kluyveri]
MIRGCKITKNNFITQKRFNSNKFQPGDYAIITPLKSSYDKKHWLSRPLKDTANAKINLNFGSIKHTDVLGKQPLGHVHTLETHSKLAKYTVSHPTLEQWINFSERNAQPIYTFDAQAIVSLTDLNIHYPEPPKNEGEKITPLQFLEAGTGHGSLSIAIAKALHPANALAHYADDLNLRGAVLHSVDCNKNHSITGKRTVKGFRRGMYSNDIEFHVADSPFDWINSEEGLSWVEREVVSKREKNLEYDSDEPKAFLSGVFLDMPGYHEHMIKLAPYVKTNGFIIVFCPSITQIIDAIDAIVEENERLSKLDIPTSLHLEHEKTVQLLDGAGGGLKEWDTRRATIRSTGKVGYSVRPKVGVRTVGGGFVAIWRKMGKDVNLEFEKEAIANFVPKPKEEYVPKTTKTEKAVGIVEAKEPVISEKVLEPEIVSKKDKLDMFPSELLSTAPEVIEDKLEEKNFEDYKEYDPNAVVNPDFKVEEASLIPHSVLDTTFHSCHGDPDVHVGLIKQVFMLETTVPADLIDEIEKSSETEEPAQPEEHAQPIVDEVETSFSDGKPKSWTKHTL